MKLRAIDIEIALLKDCNVRRNIVVPNVSYDIVRYLSEPNEKNHRKYDKLHECDILKVTPAGYATEYEIKISKSDFKADLKKKHSHDSKFIQTLYYIVPYELYEFVKNNLPENVGLGYVKKDKVIYTITAPKRKYCFKWTQEEEFKLARLGAMRIITLKKALAKQKIIKNGK